MTFQQFIATVATSGVSWIVMIQLFTDTAHGCGNSKDMSSHDMVFPIIATSIPNYSSGDSLVNADKHPYEAKSKNYIVPKPRCHLRLPAL
jgi:hypothetical protein